MNEEDITNTLEFQLGWNTATASIMEIWQGILEIYKTPEEIVHQFETFMTMCELRMNGATWDELASVAELNDKSVLAEEIRKTVKEG